MCQALLWVLGYSLEQTGVKIPSRSRAGNKEKTKQNRKTTYVR